MLNNNYRQSYSDPTSPWTTVETKRFW